MTALFTKRHYEWFARSFTYAAANGLILRYTEEQRAGIHAAALFFADNLQQDNPRFDRDRFLKMCGIEPRVPAIAPTPAVETCDGVFIAALRAQGREVVMQDARRAPRANLERVIAFAYHGEELLIACKALLVDIEAGYGSIDALPNNVKGVRLMGQMLGDIRRAHEAIAKIEPEAMEC